MPRVIPKGFLFAFVTDEERIIGKSGQMQGAKTVANPERNEKNSKISTIAKSYLVTEITLPSSIFGAATVILPFASCIMV